MDDEAVDAAVTAAAAAVAAVTAERARSSPLGVTTDK
jgi:hypothetical protein